MYTLICAVVTLSSANVSVLLLLDIDQIITVLCASVGKFYSHLAATVDH